MNGFGQASTHGLGTGAAQRLLRGLVYTLAVSAETLAWAADDAPEFVRQLSATQAHLQASALAAQSGSRPRKSVAPTLARLTGKLLSQQLPGLRIDIDTSEHPAAELSPGLSANPSANLSANMSADAANQAAASIGLASLREAPAWHFNRHAEICYDNYRLGVQRKGLVMRYERAF